MHEPKTCALGPFLIKRGISEQTVKNKRWKGYKVRQPGGVGGFGNLGFLHAQTREARPPLACASIIIDLLHTQIHGTATV